MGNHISACTLLSPKIMKPNKSSRIIIIILPSGEIMTYQDNVKAAEAMLECPNFFVVNSSTLNVNKRFSPLSANEDLEVGSVYVMFPMRRVNSVVTMGDMGVVWLAGKNAPKRISGRVSPETVTVEETRLVVDSPEFGHRLLVSRSKKPVLDTISEEPVRSSLLSLVKV